ncbi:mannose-1-phosphate guanylyltransferase [Salarchaeum sp. JOR-1]|uniref:mannose-1-phosphate guanylyltransferase n=1 Tax=Salarchaeum sp. JOR-1 TaxID=2599399 RepID=UPI0011983505|nr:sugar phosphate nucleotidyltransferase [Salarchaeum sp. JOR-1]QDX40356.1 mannose-1-phosphate guanylyltransferase [Salarchaeum sp. JOR-1]
MDTVALLLAGGTGTRLYPASRSDRPKQFLTLDGERSLLRRTADRVGFADHVYVATREAYADRVRDIVPEAGVLVEPAAKDTGPALAYATHRIREQVGSCTVLCLPSDHRVDGDFEPTARTALAAARDGFLATVGVEPTRPATGYGYIEPGAAHDGYREVAAFHEKPDADTARRYVERGWLWNAGMFAWAPDAFLAAARDGPLAPLVDALDAGDPERGFAAVESVSVDYSVMEATDQAAVVPADFDWDDLGSWDALARVRDTDADGNAVLGDALAIDTADSVLASDDKHVTAIGVENLVVAAYDDRVLVVPRGESQRVRDAVRELRETDLF